MASGSWTQDNLHVRSNSSTETKNNVSLELFRAEDAHRGTDVPIPFLFSPLHISSPVENLYGHSQNLFDAAAENWYMHPLNLSNASVHDLNMKTDVGNLNNYPLEPAFGQTTMANFVPFLGYEDPTFAGAGASMTMNSVWQDNVVGANHDMSDPNRDRKFIDLNSNGARNFHMAGLAEEPMNKARQLADSNRSLYNFTREPEIPHKPGFVQREYNNQLRVGAPGLDHLSKLDGRFLSLGYRSNAPFDGQSEASCHTSFAHLGRSDDDSFNKPSVPLSGPGENVGGFTTQHFSKNMNLSGNDISGLQTVTSGFDRCATPAVPSDEINMQHFIPTPSIKASGLQNEIGLNLSSLNTLHDCGANPAIVNNVSFSNLFPEPVQRRMQRIPFNSSVLRSNHQNASDQMQSSYVRTNMKFPPFGESSRQDQSGQDHAYPANVASNAGADEGLNMFHSGVSLSASKVQRQNVKQNIDSMASTGHGTVDTVKSVLVHPSSSLGGRSHKRSLPPLSPSPEQHKKIIPPSTHPFSPYLLKTALGQIGRSLPGSTTFRNPSLIHSAAVKGSAATNSTNHTTVPAGTIEASSAVAMSSMHAAALAEAFISPTQIPVACNDAEDISLGFWNSAMSNPTASGNIPSTSVVAGKGHSLLPSSVSRAASSAFGRTIADGTGLPRVLVNTNPSKVVTPRTLPPSLHIPAPTTMSHKKWSSTTSPAVSSLKKRLPELAALARASSAYRTAQLSASVSHIKWQGFDMPQPVGENCLLCKRDLSYNPEGAISIPPIAPAVAVLPCGHTFHDDCLSRITPTDQSKNPPCIPCAIGEK